MGFQGLTRATEDVVLPMWATPENVRRLRRCFRMAYGQDPSIDAIRESDLLGEYPAVRYYPPKGDLFSTLSPLWARLDHQNAEALRQRS